MKRILFYLPLILLVSFSCQKPNKPSPSPTPNVNVYFQIDVSTPLYSPIENEGGFVYIKGGNNGILLLQDFNGTFRAFDDSCPYNATTQCGTLRLAESGLYIICGSYSGNTINPCGPSTWNLDGTVRTGPATLPLKAYKVTQSGTILTISN